MATIRTHVLAVLLGAFSTAAVAATPLTLYKSPSCSCCEAYISYLRHNGFAVTAINREDMQAVKQQLGVTPGLGSCHSAKLGRYTIEGHVPVAAIRQLLASQADVVGLSAPGMPLNSPGMGEEKPGTLAIYTMRKDQRTGVLFGRF
ncbi:CopG protein [Aquitalea magnusonii]|uniref:CopG protein n=1 Tax=Aquitalea magnusonii TaxID=332411 RepID=A0A3G9GHQ7_9NEIS|nr:DUF411 domain-containing protein [Aquitalea magnusonii]BBF85187.1 CopG protein [Aquitalea magnusonii]